MKGLTKIFELKKNIISSKVNALLHVVNLL